MKRYALLVCAALGLVMTSGTARADWGSCRYGGYQPWYNIFANRNRCLTPEEERLQRFWHDYYNALKCYYSSLDNIDWVAYYKNHGYQINGNCGAGACGACRINYAPVFVTPTMQWAVPNTCLSGPPMGPAQYGPPGMPGGMPAMAGGPPGMMPPH